MAAQRDREVLVAVYMMKGKMEPARSFMAGRGHTTAWTSGAGPGYIALNRPRRTDPSPGRVGRGA